MTIHLRDEWSINPKHMLFVGLGFESELTRAELFGLLLAKGLGGFILGVVVGVQIAGRL